MATRPAETTLLVCLAASLSMIQANLLLGTVGKAGNSFVVLDLMRLPLGILSGMGFSGAGAIVRKGGPTNRAVLRPSRFLLPTRQTGFVFGCSTASILRRRPRSLIFPMRGGEIE